MKKLFLALIFGLPAAAAAAAAVPYLPVPKGAAVILSTGSTNTLGYRIVVQSSGAAEFVNGTRRATATVPASLAGRLFKELQAVPLSRRGTAYCMKPASFGTSLYVWWKGARSADLTCGGANSLLDAANAVAHSLGVSNGMRNPLVRPVPMLTNEPRRPMPAPTSSP